MRPAPPARSSELRDVEQWFVGRGIPHFIDDYSASTDVWTRAAPWLPLSYLAGALNGINSRFTFWENCGAVVAAMLILLAVWAGANAARGRRPLLARPARVGAPELLAFVVGPAIPALLFGLQWRSFLFSIAGGAAVLVVIYVVTSYGLVPVTRWAFGRLRAQIVTLGNLFVRALPLLLLFVTFLFISTEVWQVAGLLVGPAYIAAIGVFVFLGAVFVLSRFRGDVAEVGTFASWDEVRSLCDGTPAAALVQSERGVPDPTPASWREWLNVALLMLFTKAVQITLVAVSIGTFLVAFGVLTIPETTIKTWLGSPPHVLWSISWSGRRFALTEELLRVAGFLAAFTGLYFTVYLVTDENYRREFKDDVVGEVRQAFAARALYRVAVAASGATASESAGAEQW